MRVRRMRARVCARCPCSLPRRRTGRRTGHGRARGALRVAPSPSRCARGAASPQTIDRCGRPAPRSRGRDRRKHAVARPRFRIDTFREGGGRGPPAADRGREIPDAIRRAAHRPHAARKPRMREIHARPRVSSRRSRRRPRGAPTPRRHRAPSRAPSRAMPESALARRNSGETFRRADDARGAARRGSDDAGLNIARQCSKPRVGDEAPRRMRA
ncbi:hypothetical protein X879_4665 [Burkholderia pseudomallei MSHR3951]|nr:hypothetical protein X944_2969 [Burkholderia pseudomallei MSHR3964]KGV92980.1 hypothetical protein X892_3013 [Burkholderia pseudomallei MSHR3960]KGV94486.1 hypothetical protein X879_4665 [Burkholderia pseudomallei MSHR3951]